MVDSGPTHSPPPREEPRGLAFLTAAVAVMVMVFYVWTASAPMVPFDFRGPKQDYYNLLTHGFLAGHLYLPVQPDPRLLSPDPAVQAHAPFLLDASLYHGRYYLYFGPTPVLVAFLPWTVLFHHDLPVNFAAFLFASLGFGLSVVLLWRLRRRHGLHGSASIWLCLVVALGFCSVVPVALRTPNFYEVAIGSAYAWTMLFFLALCEALASGRRRGWWLAAASAAFGLTVGSRPTALFGGLLLPAAALGRWWPARHEAGAGRRLLRGFLAAGLPATACVGGLLFYNYQRFGDCLEFGLRYHLGVHASGAQFAPAYFWHNLRLYYFTLPEFSRYFPFFYPGRESPPPAGYVGGEFAHGQFYFPPLLLLALLGGACALRRRGDPVRLVPPAAAFGFWSFCNLLVVGSLCGRANRYQMDFQPALLLLAGFSLLLAADSLRPTRRWITIPGGALLLFGCCYNAMVSLQTTEFFRHTNPGLYARVARVFNLPSWWYQRWRHEPVGPLSLQIEFPAARPGTLEPLVATGTPWFSDVLYVEYGAGDTIRFVLEHPGYGGPSSPPVAIVPGRVYALRVQLGSLYPPEEHPFFSQLPPAQVRRLKHTVQVDLDGRTVFQAGATFYDASPGQIYVGENRLWPTMVMGRFGGRVLSRTVEPLDTAAGSRAAAAETGPVLLRVRLPRDRPGAIEPLVVTGAPGKADVLFLEYVDAGHIRFGLDYWNPHVIRSPIVPVDYTVPHEIEVGMGSLLPPTADAGSRQLLAITLDGREVFATRAVFYDTEPDAVAIGFNSVGASTCRLYFGGTILSVRRLGAVPPPAAPARGRPSGRILLRFPPGREGHSEPLFSSIDRGGVPFVAFVHYATPGSIQFGVVRGGERWEGPLVAVDYSQMHELLIASDPAGASPLPSAGALDDFFRHRWAHALGLYLDGRPAFASGPLDLPAAPAAWHWAGDPAGLLAEGDVSYTGEMEQRSPADSAAAFAALDVPHGPLQLTVALPAHSLGQREPLVVTGISGGGDALYIEYTDEHHVRFGFDHWGAGGPQSAPVPIDYRPEHRLTIGMGSLWSSDAKPPAAPAEGLWVEVDGRRVWTLPATFHPATPATRFVGANPIGISTCGLRFTGEILAAEWLAGEATGS